MTILFLTHRLPYAPNRGDRVRAFHLLRHLQARARVHVVSLVHSRDEASHRADVEPLATSVHIVGVPRLPNLARSAVGLLSKRPTTHSMLEAPGMRRTLEAVLARETPDVVLAFCSGSARWAVEQPLADLPLVLDMVDVDSAKWSDLAEVTAPPLKWVYKREHRVLGAFEAATARRAFATLVVTDREREALRRLAPDARIEVIPNGVDVEHLTPPSPPTATPSVVFCGMMDYAPNAHAALFLGESVWPAVRAKRPDAILTIVGARPTAAVRALASSSAGIVVTGAVTDVRPYLWNAAVSAAPILTARGIQNKVLEAVAARLPVVVTPNIAATLPDTIAAALSVGSTAEELARAIVDLLALSPEARRTRASAAGIDALSWKHQLDPLLPILEGAAHAGVRGRKI